ncbi:ImuA family protein [Nitrospirillum bahiense]|uniref:Protein ImuA n=1 Tax=Nitrospirillum amazonense TaxID=28077 RepID=A0A560FVP2_9PROT|nr:damage-inducible mutagenesis protein [Nitrospirillum amazonense]TWB25621.1 protein ImuA [Nitrospirillum amazonense]
MTDHAAAITALRAQLSALDRTRPVGGRPPVATGVPAIDGALPAGGLVCGGIHEVLPGRHCGAGHGFVAALLGRLPESDGRILWCRAPGPANAALYAPGIAGFGLLPGRLLQVYPRSDEDALWVMEEALRCRRLAAAVGDGLLPTPTQCRRLQLAAEAGDTLGLMLLPPTARPPPSVAMTRWRVAAAPDDPASDGLGRPRWTVNLLRCRGGGAGNWDLEWDDEALRLDLAGPVAHRPVAAAE